MTATPLSFSVPLILFFSFPHLAFLFFARSFSPRLSTVTTRRSWLCATIVRRSIAPRWPTTTKRYAFTRLHRWKKETPARRKFLPAFSPLPLHLLFLPQTLMENSYREEIFRMMENRSARRGLKEILVEATNYFVLYSRWKSTEVLWETLGHQINDTSTFCKVLFGLVNSVIGIFLLFEEIFWIIV